MNYEEMSDKELDVSLTSLVYELDGWEYSPMGSMFFHCGVDGSGFYEQKVVNYCTDWNATMPLAIENSISLINGYSEHYFACDGFSDCANCEGGGIYYDIYAEDKYPLRAIVICLIKILESLQ